jgi:PPK2 family polyphosphate:nucleotide phosphotransferase
MIDSPYLVRPGKKFHFDSVAPDDTGRFKHKDDAAESTRKNTEKLGDLQEVLYGEGKRSVLIVLQGMDTSGKDGAIKHVFSSVNPQGCTVTSFKRPSSLELAHDYLWRYHLAVPHKGMIGIFNRSHYESVLVERVHAIVSKGVWSKRYDQINDFERMLVAEGVRVLKFFLHISKEEQKRRLEARLADASKHWKFDPGDLAERKLWDEYANAYEDAVERCSTEDAPWYIVPADHKWFRNWVLSDTIVRAMEEMKLKFPAPAEGLDKVKVK